MTPDANVDETHAIGFDDAPAGAAKAGIDADDANRSSLHASRITRTGRCADAAIAASFWLRIGLNC